MPRTHGYFLPDHAWHITHHIAVMWALSLAVGRETFTDSENVKAALDISA